TNGVDIAGSLSIVMGNYIGTDRTGTVAVPNAGFGVALGAGASTNTIGGASGGARNVISANGLGGVSLGFGLPGPGVQFNKVVGNYIGTDKNGTAALGNSSYGVVIGGGSSSNTV